MLVGNGQPTISALVVPNFDAVRRWATREGLDLPDEPTQIVDDGRVQARIEAIVESTNEAYEPHERVHQARFLSDPYTVENGLLTPTRKKRRRAIIEQQADRIDALYENSQ